MIQPAYRLNVYQAAPTPIASVDIIAVHDLEESQESAWTYELTSRHLNSKSPDTPRSPDGKPDPIAMGGKETPGEGLPSPLNPRPMRTEPRDNKLKTSRRDNKESIKEKASIRSSSEFERPEKPRRVNWLRDFLTNDIPNSRVLAFSYPGPKFERKQPTWMEYVESAAKDLLQRIKRSRSIFYQKEVPIVFIGYGFGGIIIQKALELAAKENMPPRERPEKKKPEEKPKEHVYQVLFLDTPFPKIHDSERGHLFPDNTNVRMCQILLEIEMREKGAKLVEKTWLSLQGRLEVVPTPLNFDMTWMYSHGRVKQPEGDAKSQLVKEEEFNAMRKYRKQKMTFTSVSIYKHRRLARVPDTQDYIYKAICSRIQAKLLFQSIPVRNVALIQTILESKALPEEVEVKDWKGRTPLHYAAALYPPSEDIVTLLINERPSETVEPDNDGRIPLHDAVLTAWEQEPPEGIDRSECSGVIRYLLRNMQRGDMEVQDNEGVSPWDQMTCEKEGCCCEEDECAAVWIQELRENLEPISGPAISQDYVLPTEPTPPEKDSAQYLATFTSQGAVSEFYHSFNQINHKLEEHINLKTPSVYEMIYDSDKGCARILEFSRRRESYQDFRCRWIHVPANN
ncbi:hypothetical protein QBC37DRAFT_284262, partial [Rhypophila decipiens]